MGIFLGDSADHDYWAGKLLHDGAQGSQTIETGHLDIEGNDIRIKAGDSLQSLGAGRSGGYDFESGLGSDHTSERGAHEGAVVHNQNADLGAGCGEVVHVR